MSDNSTSELLELPSFMKWRTPNEEDIRPVEFWAPQLRTCIPEVDTALGIHYAVQLHEIARLQGSGLIIQVVLMEMIRGGHAGYIEDAFLKEIAARSYVGSHGVAQEYWN